MRRRGGFTLVELLVSLALSIFILTILATAFSTGLTTFREIKAIGDLQARLRSATALLRRDLAADHFEGRRRLSDAAEVWRFRGRPREGFFRLQEPTMVLPGEDEGADGDGIPARRRTSAMLHFTVKLRGNQREAFAATLVRSGSPLLSTRTTFFDQPAEGRYQEPPASGPDTAYNSQWLEVAYFLASNGDSAGGTPLFALYRSQFIVTPDSSKLNDQSLPAALAPQFPEVSCQPAGGRLFFNNPTTLARRTEGTQPRRAFDAEITPPRLGQPTVLLYDVISFDVQVLRERLGLPLEAHDLSFDTGDTSDAWDTPGDLANPILALHITLRVWDAKAKLARQITIVQDM
jgi:type II secretory pathway pseudopilin PulG